MFTGYIVISNLHKECLEGVQSRKYFISLFPNDGIKRNRRARRSDTKTLLQQSRWRRVVSVRTAAPRSRAATGGDLAWARPSSLWSGLDRETGFIGGGSLSFSLFLSVKWTERESRAACYNVNWLTGYRRSYVIGMRTTRLWSHIEKCIRRCASTVAVSSLPSFFTPGYISETLRSAK